MLVELFLQYVAAILLKNGFYSSQISWWYKANEQIHFSCCQIKLLNSGWEMNEKRYEGLLCQSSQKNYWGLMINMEDDIWLKMYLDSV